MLYSKKQHLFLIVYEFIGASNEVILFRENTDAQSANSKTSTVKGLFIPLSVAFSTTTYIDKLIYMCVCVF